MFEKSKIKLGIAPIAWTNDDMPDLGGENTFEQCVSEMALAGYMGCEVGNKYPKDPEILKSYLEPRGLQIANAWFSAFLLTDGYEKTKDEFIKACEFLRAMGAKIIGLSEQSYSIQGKLHTPVFEEKYILSNDEWAILANGLNRLGEIAQEYDIQLTFHHHMGTVVQTAEETDRLLYDTDPNFVGLLFDTGHFAYCGENPLIELSKHHKRIKHVHLKDIRPDMIKKVKDEKLSFLQGVRLGTFTVPGDGAIDFLPIFKELSDQRYSGWLLVEAEQDPAVANPFIFAKKARNYICEIAGI